MERLKVKGETKIALGIILAIYLVFNTVKVFFFIDQSITWHLITSGIGLIAILFFGYVVRTIDIYMDSIYPFERNPAKRIAIQFLVTLTVIMIIRIVPTILFQDRIPIHLTRELWAATIALNIFMVLSVILSIFGYHFFIRWKQERIVAAELEKEKALVQYDNLKNQLNPHFLFNALSSLNSLIFENPQLASDFLQQLSKVYRYVLENKEKNSVSVQKEMNFVSHYVKLLETRFGEGLTVAFNIDEASKEKNIVPVTLQILLENAVKHNTTSKDNPLHITVTSSGDYLSVKNNLQRKHAIETSNKHGLENLRNLYRYISDKQVEVIETAESFEIKIPLT
ncbi:MAG TPA: histidine kinase [Chitinophagales bacterium]|nr:histidine kinase [Chitinophagales bacterium]